MHGLPKPKWRNIKDCYPLLNMEEIIEEIVDKIYTCLLIASLNVTN